VREQAQSLGLFDNKKYNSFMKNDVLKDTPVSDSPLEEVSEEKQKNDFVEITEN
jgi:hypothetical protein